MFQQPRLITASIGSLQTNPDATKKLPPKEAGWTHVATVKNCEQPERIDEPVSLCGDRDFEASSIVGNTTIVDAQEERSCVMH